MIKTTGFWRALVQWGFLACILFIGVEFGLFVRHFETAGASPLFLRSPGVEGFLPIGALASLKHWWLSGEINPVHPAALVLLVTFVAMSLLAQKSFCSWLCPVGTLSESFWKGGQRLFGRTFSVWRPLDILLRGLKYALLGFFVKILLIDMPGPAVAGFLKSPYWAISDVKMLHFFTGISLTAGFVIAVLTVLSLVYKNFWCRYLCPYGALLGLFALVGPMKIRRFEQACTGCRRCDRACPSALGPSVKSCIRSAECTGCLSCMDACPTAALGMAPPFWKKPLPRWVFPALVIAIYASGVLLGMATGHWETSLSYQDYQRLIPMAGRFGH